MAYIATIEQLVEEVQTYLDTDPRFFDQDAGSFEWWGERVYYERGPDDYILHIDGAKVHCPRL